MPCTLLCTTPGLYWQRTTSDLQLRQVRHHLHMQLHQRAASTSSCIIKFCLYGVQPLLCAVFYPPAVQVRPCHLCPAGVTQPPAASRCNPVVFGGGPVSFLLHLRTSAPAGANPPPPAFSSGRCVLLHLRPSVPAGANPSPPPALSSGRCVLLHLRPSAPAGATLHLRLQSGQVRPQLQPPVAQVQPSRL